MKVEKGYPQIAQINADYFLSVKSAKSADKISLSANIPQIERYRRLANTKSSMLH